MRSKRFTPLRYQLKKEGLKALSSGHPWIFRDKISSAADVFPNGQWLKLVDAANKVVGYGIFEKEGLIGIRVLKRGETPPSLSWIQGQVEKALKKRRALKEYTDAIRWLHGENDNFPGVVIDGYGDTAVLQTYSKSVDTLGRYLAAFLRSKVGIANIVWKLPAKRKREEVPEMALRLLRGQLKETISFHEGKQQLVTQVGPGQKSGLFLDLRGLRKWIALQKWNGKRVLNLFSYTGTLGFAAEWAGAGEVVNVDIAPKALEHGKKFHIRQSKKSQWVAADVFEWVKELPAKELFDVIIVDPPMMASRIEQVPKALHAYKLLYTQLKNHLKPHGTLVGCCCTSRIRRQRLATEMESWLGRSYQRKLQLPPEDDHPVGFPEGDYLKVFIYERR